GAPTRRILQASVSPASWTLGLLFPRGQQVFRETLQFLRFTRFSMGAFAYGLLFSGGEDDVMRFCESTHCCPFPTARGFSTPSAWARSGDGNHSSSAIDSA